MGIETLTRSAKITYEEWFAQQPNGIDRLLFPLSDADTSASFMMDRFIQTPAGIVYRDANNQSHVRPYEPGTGYIYNVPRASEKTPVGEELRDAAITGVDPTSSQTTHVQKLLSDIVKDHVAGHNVTKWKQAIDVIFEGEFYAKGDSGTDINLGIDFDRASANELTHDFTSTDTQPIAFKEMQDQLIAQGSPTSNIIAILGETYLNDFFTDTAITAYLQANSATQLLEMQMMPESLKGNSQIKVLATYRAPNMIAPVYVCSFSPGAVYYPYKGASATDWITKTKAAMFSLDSPRYYITRGMDIRNDSGETQRVVGDIVFDTYSENDPIVDFLRSQTRHIFIPGNINHTVVSTGTFS
jgi:hypothetical protein